MIEFLKMGGYAGYVWSCFGIATVVLVLNVVLSWRRYQSILRRLKQLHTATENNES